MPACTRMGVDFSTGHTPFPPRPADQGSPDVFTNFIPQVRVSDHYPKHPKIPVHDSFASAGSPNVFVNNLPIHRIGDAIDCGDMSGAGSPNVFANS